MIEEYRVYIYSDGDVVSFKRQEFGGGWEDVSLRDVKDKICKR